MDDERVWLRHKDTGHFFQCPAGAVEDWTTPEMGWEPTDERPEEPNLVAAELLAWQQERAQRAVAAQEPEQESTTAPAGPRPETEE